MENILLSAERTFAFQCHQTKIKRYERGEGKGGSAGKPMSRKCASSITFVVFHIKKTDRICGA